MTRDFFAGIVSKEEFLAAGVDGLPSFVAYKDLGHHYDEESEYFLHHEELYHSTPETQTDESYNHPEGELPARISLLRMLTAYALTDLEHFARAYRQYDYRSVL